MLNKILKSIYVKPGALVIAGAVLCMSFKMKGTGEVVLSAGTPVPLETVSMIRTDQTSVGQLIDFRVKSDVIAGETVVIAAGTIVKGQVMRAQKAKGLGKEGFIEIQLKSVKAVDGQEIFLSGGNVFKEGESKQTLAIVLGVLICILFLTMKGKDASIPAGYEVIPAATANTTIKI